MSYIKIYCAVHVQAFDQRAVNQTDAQPLFLLGDFNRCDVASHLPNLEQYVTAPRMSNILDLCYGNIPNAYISKPGPSLGQSDHNVILLLLKYKSQLKTRETITKNIKVWNNEATETLRGCTTRLLRAHRLGLVF